MRSSFVPGVMLSEQFYHEAVRPILIDQFPNLEHAAALIGDGSEVLGFDDEMSTDHHWGPRVLLFLREEDQINGEQVQRVLAERLPLEFRGYPTNFSGPDPNDNGTQLLQPILQGPVNHRVTVQTVRGFFLEYLQIDITHALDAADWLSVSEQRLRAVTSGAIYHDDLGLRRACGLFAYYPRDVWLYQLAATWNRIGQDEHLMGRAGAIGDEVGSAVIGARLVRDIMRLCFLMEKTYAPYPKWFGTAFRQLACAPDLWAALLEAVHAAAWRQREAYLVQAYEYLAAWHNALGLTEPLAEKAVPFFGRPFRVMAVQGFAQALAGRIEDPRLKHLAVRPLIGGIDLLSDNTDFVSDPGWRPMARQLYETAW